LIVAWSKAEAKIVAFSFLLVSPSCSKETANARNSPKESHLK